MLHLDLSGMNLRKNVKPIIEAVKNAEHLTLISIHLHDNEFDMETKRFILTYLGIDYENFKDEIRNIDDNKVNKSKKMPNRSMKHHQHKF